MKILIRRTALDYLKHHARENRGQEIYGWLLGVEQTVEDEVHLFILGSYSAHKYMVQTLVNTEPDTNELASIGDYLPIGINNLGQYHSHPNNVFHSETDDTTLLDMAKVYKNVISIVTNGEETNVYCVVSNKVEQLNYTILEIDKLYYNYLDVEIPLKLDMDANRNKLAMEAEAIIKGNLSELILNNPVDKILLKQIDLGDISTNLCFKIPIFNHYKTLKTKSIFKGLSISINKYILDVLYETIGKFENKELSPDMIEYQGIPINIIINSFSRKTANQRAILMKSFGLKKESKKIGKIAE
jgi:proteasome lid subunit RPN8/RPN11